MSDPIAEAQKEEPPAIMEMYEEREGRLAKLRFAVDVVVITAAITVMIAVDEAATEEQKGQFAEDIQDLRYCLFQLRTAWQYLRGER